MTKIFDIYVETSVWNFLDAPDAYDKQIQTHDFFKMAKQNGANLYISEVTLAEVKRASSPRREWLENIIESHSPKLLGLEESCLELAEEYLKSKIVPRRYENDAFHIAIAACYDLDVLVSWNMKHIVKLNTRRGINAINKLYGYKELEICTPAEVF